LEDANRDFAARLIHLQRVQTLNETVSTLAHQLSQPLTAIRTYAETIQEDVIKGTMDRDELAQLLARVVDAANSGHGILSSVRERIRIGEPHYEAANLNELVRGVLQMVEIDARRSRVARRLELQEDLPPIHCDAIQIEQVILNLVRNAMQSLEQTEDTKRVLEVQTRLIDDTLELSVGDNGIGILPGQEEQLFEPFFTTRAEGLGLGLAICRTIVEEHGGNIRAERRPSGGAVFRVRLPASSSE